MTEPMVWTSPKKSKKEPSQAAQAVYTILRQIPRGKVTTYAAIAHAIGSHPRGVASILHNNPDPDGTPCCLVVRSDGHISGYALGLEEKKKRLAAWGVELDGEYVKRACIIGSI